MGSGKLDRRMVLSTLWVFLAVNYIFCDVLSIMEPVFFGELMAGAQVSGMEIDQAFLLGAAILVEIPFIMIVLSRILKYKLNRIANIIAGALMAFVQIMSLFVGPPTLHYMFFSAIEITANLVIVWYAWTWRE